MSRNLIWSSREESVGDRKKLSPLLKWNWGKRWELEHVFSNLPQGFKSYFEPFVWWGSVYTSIEAENYYINDKSHELIDLYRIITWENRWLFFSALETINDNWDTLWEIPERNKDFFLNLYRNFYSESMSWETLSKEIHGFIERNASDFYGLFWAPLNCKIAVFIKEVIKNLIRKISRMRDLEKEWGVFSEADIINNIETALRSAFYIYLRFLYNHHQKYWLDSALYTAIFLFMRNFAYGWMFRYNDKWDFNVPYGWVSYNKLRFRKRVEYLTSDALSALLQKTEISNDDFEPFFEKHPPTQDDFVFLDPPYDSEFNEYAGNTFWDTDQKRLARYLLEKCEARWMMIIWKTALISELYKGPKVNIRTYDKKYLTNMRNRNAQAVQHLLITNY